MTVTIDGELRSLDYDAVTSRDFKQIAAHTGLNPQDFYQKVNDGGLPREMYDAIRWLFLGGANSGIPLAEADDYPLAAFMLAYIEASGRLTAAVEAVEAKADPKARPASPKPKRASRAGSKHAPAKTSTP